MSALAGVCHCRGEGTANVHAQIDPKLDYTGMRPLSFIVDDVRARADARVRDGDFEAAASEYGVLVTLAPRDLTVWLKLAHARARSGHLTGAAEAYFAAAAIYAKRGYGKRALLLGRRALTLAATVATPTRLQPLVDHLGATAAPLLEQAMRAHLLMRRPEVARQLIGMLLQADPSGLDRRWQLVEVQLAEGEWVDAVDQLYVVARGLLQQGRIADYVRAAEMALRYGGPNAELLRELSRIYRRSGEKTAALAKLELLRRIDPEDSEALELLARERIELGHVSSGIAYLERVVGAMLGRGDLTGVRSLLSRAADWSGDDIFAKHLERVRVDALVRRRPCAKPPLPPLPRRPELHLVEDELEFVSLD